MEHRAEQAARKPKQPAFEILRLGSILIPTKRLLPAERSAVDDLVAQLRATEDEIEVRAITGKLHHYAVRPFPMKYLKRIDRSRYQGDLLAHVKKFGGAKEQARAAKRRANQQLLAA